jgi:hypothetical protein
MKQSLGSFYLYPLIAFHNVADIDRDILKSILKSEFVCYSGRITVLGRLRRTPSGGQCDSERQPLIYGSQSRHDYILQHMSYEPTVQRLPTKFHLFVGYFKR